MYSSDYSFTTTRLAYYTYQRVYVFIIFILKYYMFPYVVHFLRTKMCIIYLIKCAHLLCALADIKLWSYDYSSVLEKKNKHENRRSTA
jgi:hypothetical protein